MKKQEKELVKKIEYEEKLIADVPVFFELNAKAVLKSEEIQKLRELRYISDLGISSEGDIDVHRGKFKDMKTELSRIRDTLAEAEKEKREVSEYDTTYLRQMQSDYNFILEKLKREREELAQAEKQLEEERQREEQNADREEISR